MEINGRTSDMDEAGVGTRIITGGVTTARGFKAASTATGIKYKDHQDMAMIYSREPCRSAGTFTTNTVKVAPVKWGKSQVTNGAPARAVVVNAGITDACTGEEGMGYYGQTAEAAILALGTSAESVLVASTGATGMQLPTDRITAGVKAMAPLLDGSLESGTDASMTVMTTDTENKEVTVRFELGGTTVTMGGIYRGSGMIHPNICTMLSFVTTDVAISKELLQKILSQDTQDTYSMISVDGDTSTNDVVLLLANGLAGNKEITEKNEDYHTLCRALKIVNETLAKKMTGDDEGCTTLSEVKVMGAETKEQAKILAKSVICSSLTKAAIFGHDASWDRILCAMGYSGAQFDPGKVDLFFESAAGKMQIIKNGIAVDYSEEQATRILSEPGMTAVANIEMGDAEAAAWGCDLIFNYIKINADYHS